MMITMATGTLAVGLFSNCTFGAGVFGRNTAPTILDFKPSTTSFNLLLNENQTFNITFIDYDCNQAISIEWFRNNIFNVSNSNLTVKFDDIGVFNITANVSDGSDNSYEIWLVTINKESFVVRISDFGIEWITLNWTGAGNITIEYSPNNLTNWKNITNTDSISRLGYQSNLQADTEYFFRAANTTSDYSYIVQKTKAIRESDQFYIYLIVFIIFGIIISLGYWLNDPYLHVLGGMFPIFVALHITNISFANLGNDFLKTSFVAILLGLGLFYIISGSFKIAAEEF